MSGKKPIPYPSFDHLNEYQQSYIRLVPEGTDLLTALQDSFSALCKTLDSVDEKKSGEAYAEGKWSIKTLVMHLCDCELIFLYRCLSIARGSRQEHPGFDENEYAITSKADEAGWNDILEQYKTMAGSLFYFFKNIPGDAYLQTGTANGVKVSPQQVGFMAAGHRLHHLRILKERYGI